MLAPTTLPITIRPAYADDDGALRRLSALDSAAVPHGPLFVAEVDGELWAAVSLKDLTAVADPFRPTADVVALVRDHITRSRRAAQRPARRATVVALPRDRRLRVA